jgi:hypothetical protein
MIEADTMNWVRQRTTSNYTAVIMNPQPMHAVLAGFLMAWREKTPYAKDDDYVFPSFRPKGKKPYSGQNPTGDESGLQTRATIWAYPSR